MLREDGPFESDSREESPFSGIIPTCWFVIVSITTVGYGDDVPTSLGGKLVGSVTILFGLVAIAMPVAAVGSRFSSEYYRALEERQKIRQARRLELLRCE